MNLGKNSPKCAKFNLKDCAGPGEPVPLLLGETPCRVALLCESQNQSLSLLLLVITGSTHQKLAGTERHMEVLWKTNVPHSVLQIKISI